MAERRHFSWKLSIFQLGRLPRDATQGSRIPLSVLVSLVSFPAGAASEITCSDNCDLLRIYIYISKLEHPRLMSSRKSFRLSFYCHEIIWFTHYRTCSNSSSVLWVTLHSLSFWWVTYGQPGFPVIFDLKTTPPARHNMSRPCWE